MGWGPRGAAAELTRRWAARRRWYPSPYPVPQLPWAWGMAGSEHVIPGLALMSLLVTSVWILSCSSLPETEVVGSGQIQCPPNPSLEAPPVSIVPCH